MAALPQAGVDLQAKNFNKYIKQLKTIETRQESVFGTTYTKTTQSYEKVTKASQTYDNQLKKTQQTQRNFSNGLNTAAAGLVAFATSQGVVATIEAAKAAAAFDGQRVALGNLAAQYGQSGAEITAAITRAANGTISASQAMQAANQGILLGVAQTPEEFEKITSAALKLGRTLGLSAPDAIEQFTTALGRKSLLILDNFGISAKQVNAEMEKLAQQQFGQNFSALEQGAKDALFMEAALKIASEAAAVIGDEAGKASVNFDRLNAQAENLKVAFGQAVLPLVGDLSGLLADAAVTAQQLLAFISAGASGIGNILSQVKGNFSDVLSGEKSFLDPLALFRDLDFQSAGEAATDAFKNVARVQGVTFPGDELAGEVNKVTEATQAQEEQFKASEDAVKSYEGAIRQAENLQLSFARQAEDALRKLTRSQKKLAQNQAKEINDLFIDQQKSLDDFEKDRVDQIAKAEQAIIKERQSAGKQQLKQQRDLQRELKQAQDRFNLSQLQSQRRFALDERRLLAEGDILGIQQLREDFALQNQENKENFGLSQKETKASGQDRIRDEQEQTRQRQEELQQRLAELKQNLENERVELLTSFDTQEQELRAKQLQQRQDLLVSYAEQQEDARINQQRQLEDLGRSLARQKDVTSEGVNAVSGEIEKIFGQEGVADAIFGGFTTRTESEFTQLFADIEKIVTDAETKLAATSLRIPSTLTAGRNPNLPIRLPGFDEGGIVPGPRGSSQIIQAHGGETVLPTHKINNPVIPSQTLNVMMGGEFNIRGGESAGKEATQAAINDMVEMMGIAVERIAKR